MKTNWIIFLLLFAAGLPAYSQRNTNPVSDASALNKVITSARVDNLSTEESVVSILSQMNVSGGIVTLQGCPAAANESLPKHYFDFSGLTLRQALDRITTDDHGYKWAWNNGSVVLLPVTGTPELLRTHIR